MIRLLLTATFTALLASATARASDLILVEPGELPIIVTATCARMASSQKPRATRPKPSRRFTDAISNSAVPHRALCSLLITAA